MIYRREIDGLRAVAVIPVILFHANLPGFSGGFVGVDVFFVISGYLITTIVLNELADGAFSLTRFYERRARRILPALFVVTLATVVASWAILLPEDLKNFSKSLLAVTLFASNFLFWSESGYFDTRAELLPLLHTWSLAVEEQYYLVFPLLAAALFRKGLKAVVIGLSSIAIISFALGQWGSTAYPDAAFYLLPFRVWELMLGALAAIYLEKWKRTPDQRGKLSSAFASIGLILIFLSVHRYDRATPFPGVYALAPTIGAVLVIVFARPQNTVGRLLGSPVIVGTGLLSYSAYLWHQPLFALARRASIATPPLAVFMGLTAATLVLAFFTRHLVELPFRSASRVSRRSILVGAAATSTLLVAMALGLYGNKGFPERIDNYAMVADTFRWQDLATTCGSPLLPTGIRALCRLPASSSAGPIDIALFGDSHADALLPAVVVASRQKNLAHAYMGLGGCLPLIGVDVRAGNWPPEVCSTLAEEQYQYAAKAKPRNVLLVARWSMYIENKESASSARMYFLVESASDPSSKDHSRKVFVQALERTVRAYAALGSRVFLLEQVPEQNVDPKAVFHKINQRGLWGEEGATAVIGRNSLPTSQLHIRQAVLRQLLDKVPPIEGWAILRPGTHSCSATTCPLGDKDGPYYHDKDHLNIRGAEKMGPWLATQLGEAAQDASITVE